jgi:hypothetical protein
MLNWKADDGQEAEDYDDDDDDDDDEVDMTYLILSMTQIFLQQDDKTIN